MTRIKVQMCNCLMCRHGVYGAKKQRQFQTLRHNRQFRRKGKALLKQGIEELPHINIIRYIA